MYFDGNGDYLSFADHADWTFGTDDFTVEFWVRFSSTSGTQFLLSSTADVSGFLRFSWNDSSSYWHWYNYTTGSQTFADTISADTWYHIAFVRASGLVKLYEN